MEKDYRMPLTVDEVAERLRVHPRTVCRMIERGELAGLRVGRLWRVLAEDFDEFTDGSCPLSERLKDANAGVLRFRGLSRLLVELGQAGISLTFEDGTVYYRVAQKPADPELIDALREYVPDLRELLDVD